MGEEYLIPVTRQLAVAAEAAGDTDEALNAYKQLAEQPVSATSRSSITK